MTSKHNLNDLNNKYFLLKCMCYRMPGIKKMLFKQVLNSGINQNRRWFCVAIEKISDSFEIQQTKYKIDDWTDIKPRFRPFVGIHLYQQKYHPLRLVQEQIGEFFNNWFQKNVPNEQNFKIIRGTDPVETNTSSEKVPNAFYINRNFKLRTDLLNRELNYLKCGLNNFVLVADLYRRCEMDGKHFPVFHRVNIVRTMECDKITSEAKQHFENEQKTVLIEMIQNLFGNDIKYRWINTNWANIDPSWALEIYHHDEWQRLCGTGHIRSDFFAKAERNNVAGWEIGIGLDRLTMALYNIFDIRIFWNNDRKYWAHLAEKNKALDKKETKNKDNQQADNRSKVSKLAAENPIQLNVPKQKIKIDKYISYILPENIELESFPMDDLCKFIQDGIGGIAEKV